MRRMPARTVLPWLLLAALACSGGGGSSTSSGGGNGDPGGGDPGGGDPGGDPPTSGWNAAVEIGAVRNTFSVEIYGADVDLNEGGTAIAAWEEDGDTTGSAWIAWYRAGAWEPEVKVSEGFGRAILPRVALNDAGAAVVAFEVVEYDGPGIASNTVWARRWVGGAWTAAVRLCDAPAAPNELYAYRPRVGIDGAGRALVAWEQVRPSSSVPTSVYASRFDGTSWSAPFLVSDGTIYAAWPDVAVSANGTAAVVWVQDTNPYDPGQSGGGPSVPNIWARRFDGSAWSAGQRIGADLLDYEGCERPSVVMDGAGRAFAIWEEHKLDHNRIAAARLDDAGQWSARAVLDASTSNVHHRSFPSIATDGSGRAFAAWRSDSLDRTLVNGAAARFDPAGGWDAAELFETSSEVSDACAAMGAGGNGWALFTAVGSLRARRDDPILGWQDVQTLGSAIVTDVDANGAGAMLVVGHGAYYQYNPPAFLDVARGIVYLP
jgi:hypothetical protein